MLCSWFLENGMSEQMKMANLKKGVSFVSCWCKIREAATTAPYGYSSRLCVRYSVFLFSLSLSCRT